ncbi:MAG: ATP-binding cassette domain-containing protein [Spirochaetia bacterium]|nr:ATP-binding cassette domain-containing protein [Spirochaetia bacterium]MCF7940754.1 ATP-binding cassette domain-containing protein [Spirochaetia bacterium]
MINLSAIRMAYGSRVLIQNGNVQINDGEKVGLVGPNGSGKTTVFRIITGEEEPDEGVLFMDPGTVVGYFSQDTAEMSGTTAIEEVLSGAGEVHTIGKILSELEHRMSDPEGEGLSDSEMDRYGELQMAFQHLDGYSLEVRAEAILEGLGFDEERRGNRVESFSGGWKMRISLAKILLLDPDVLLIDEPTNHLDVESIVWLEGWLRSFKGSLIMTSHDREFMTRLCSKTLEIAAGTLTLYSGDYDFYLRERDLRREQLIASQKRQQAMLAKEEKFIARFAARASHASQVQSRIKTIDKIERIEIPPEQKVMRFTFDDVRRSGDIVVEMQQLAKSWTKASGGELPVFSGITGTVVRGNRIAVTGINGAGKSTLLKVITEQTAPTAGSCTLGSSVSLGYFSQYSSDTLDPSRTIFQEVSERIPQATIGYVKSLLGAFQFSGDDAEKKISILSGGERSRVMLAVILASPVNFLVLDEPTNHLDIASREVLLEALCSFTGTIMIVSHDRYVLRRLVNRVFEIDHGQMRTFEGSYEYYLEKRQLAY